MENGKYILEKPKNAVFTLSSGAQWFPVFQYVACKTAVQKSGTIFHLLTGVGDSGRSGNVSSPQIMLHSRRVCGALRRWDIIPHHSLYYFSYSKILLNLGSVNSVYRKELTFVTEYRAYQQEVRQNNIWRSGAWDFGFGICMSAGDVSICDYFTCLHHAQ